MKLPKLNFSSLSAKLKALMKKIKLPRFLTKLKTPSFLKKIKLPKIDFAGLKAKIKGVRFTKEGFVGFVKKRYSTVLSAAIIITGALYVIAACHLFFTGGDIPYTRERVGDYLMLLLVPSFITVAFVILAQVFNKKWGGIPDERRTPDKTLGALKKRLDNMYAKLALDACPDEVKAASAKEKVRRRNALIVAVTVSAVALIASILVVADTSRYTIENLNSDIAGASVVILFSSGLAIAGWCAYSVVCAVSLGDELSALKAAVRDNEELIFKEKESVKKESVSFFDSDKFRNTARIILVAAAGALIILGVLNGGMADVLDKAVKICTECIGLG